MRTWVRRGGLSTLVFLLPLLVIFGVFSWLPIVRAAVMSVQQTNLVTAPEFVGLENFESVQGDPLFWTALQNTGMFAVIALVFGYPLPLVLAVLMSEVRRYRGLFSAIAYLPVVVAPVVAVLMWKFFYDARPDGAADLQLRLRLQPRRRLRSGHRVEPDARGVPGRAVRPLLLADPILEHLMSTPTSTWSAIPSGRRPVAAEPAPRRHVRWPARRAVRGSDEQPPRGIVSDTERRTPSVRVALGSSTRWFWCCCW